MNLIIGAQHEFHDRAFVEGWADRFAPTPERIELFDVMLSELKTVLSPDGCIVELGIGPGYLADHLLHALPHIQYHGIDFSNPMLNISRRRLKPYAPRIKFSQADLIKDTWWENLSEPANAIVSTWALHDLGSQEHVASVYNDCAQTLRAGGIFLNGDFIKPDNAIHEYEPGRFEIAKHVSLLRSAGFDAAECLVVLEEEIEAPTAGQNYACFKGVVSDS